MLSVFVYQGLLAFSSAYVNIALNKPAFQQNQYYPDDDRFDASNAVDGLKSDLIARGGQCVVSAEKHSTATWWVNLTSIHSIHHITIYYRTDNVAWDINNNFTGRFLGFSVYVSNTTDRLQGALCFKDNQFNRTTIPAVFTTPCYVHGQFVIYYNERLAGVTYPPGYSTQAFNELCELEVYGCATGFNKTDCSVPCPDVNCEHCQLETGTCQGCIAGYQGHRCELACKRGTYGPNCSMSCGHCLESEQCHHINGSCMNGCERGYQSLRCTEECTIGFYGVECSSICGHCLNNIACHHATGACVKGCDVGYRELNCTEECKGLMYGKDCHISCGHCLASEQCHHINGTCMNGCDNGYQGINCTQECDDFYFGRNCQNRCNATCKSCNKTTGICDNGCHPGWKGIFCQEECTAGWYGDQCNHSCGYCLNGAPCFHVSGSCVHGCQSGYQVPYCIEACEGGMYGENCSTPCGHCLDSDQCHHINGTCMSGCDSGYHDDKCLKECNENYFGRNCENMCNVTCKSCNITTGICDKGCQPGWSGRFCQEECTIGYYGEQCNTSCGQCLNNSGCHHVTGACVQGCKPGYQEPTCKEECDSRMYGPHCRTPCGHCLDSEQCHHINGMCVNGCANGYQGLFCTEEVPIILHFESSNDALREGKSAWFELLVLSTVVFEVQWFHNEDLITNASARYKLTSRKNENGTLSHMLNIASVLQRDNGDWKITISWKGLKTTRNLTVTVIPRLKLLITPQYDIAVPIGEGADLKCTVNNPESLIDVRDGNLIIRKNGSPLTDVSYTAVSIIWSTSAATDADSGRYTCLHTSYPDPVFVSVNITVIQPEHKKCESERSDGILWTTALAGTTKEEHCPENQNGKATRYCDLSGIWQSPSLINCTNEALMNASTQLDSMIEDGIQNTEKVRVSINSTLQLMKNLTSAINEIRAGDLSASLDVLEKIVTVTNITGSSIEKEVFYAVVDNVLSTNNSKSWTTVSEKTEKDGSSLLKNMERLSEVVIQNDNITVTRFSGVNFELTINQTQVDEVGIRFPDVSLENDTKHLEDYSTFLQLPQQISITKKAINYVAVKYKTMSEILPSSLDSRGQKTDEQDETTLENVVVNSPILSLTTQTGLEVLMPPLNLTFKHVKIMESNKMYAVCVSWDFTISKWTEKGCSMNESDSKRTVCQCNHLTNFAILMRPYSKVSEDRQSLKTMSLVGVIISIAFTFLTFVIYILTWRYVKSDQNIIMLNLCGSFVLSYLIFISAVEETGNEGLCIGITFLIHYLFLVTFFSMLGMGVYYFMSITVTYYAMYVANNFKSKSRLRWFLLGVWGIPAIITATTLGAFYGKDYHQQFYCWLSMESGSLYMFIIPVCLIIMLNLIIIGSLVRVLCASSVMTKSSLQKKATSAVRSLGTLIPVLGVTWLFGILAVNEKAEMFQYIFVIANSLQGLFIFVSHVLLNKKVMQGLRNKYPFFSTLMSFTEESKKETTSVSRSQSTSRSDTQTLKTKKKGWIARFHGIKSAVNNKVKKSESYLTEKTVSTDCSTSDLNEKNSVNSENELTSHTLELILEEGRTESRFPFSFNLNPWKKKYNVTEM